MILPPPKPTIKEPIPQLINANNCKYRSEISVFQKKNAAIKSNTIVEAIAIISHRIDPNNISLDF